MIPALNFLYSSYLFNSFDIGNFPRNHLKFQNKFPKIFHIYFTIWLFGRLFLQFFIFQIYLFYKLQNVYLFLESLWIADLFSGSPGLLLFPFSRSSGLVICFFKAPNHLFVSQKLRFVYWFFFSEAPDFLFMFFQIIWPLPEAPINFFVLFS